MPAMEGSCLINCYRCIHVQGFLVTRGSGYRKERKGSPQANIFRQWCDAQARACIIVLQASGSSIIDTVLVDLSTLRSADLTQVRYHHCEAAVWPLRRSSESAICLERHPCSISMLGTMPAKEHYSYCYLAISHVSKGLFILLFSFPSGKVNS